MSVTINGSTGISGVDGTASTPAVQGGDSNTGVFFPAADNIGFATGGTIRGRWTTDGLCFNADTAAANALNDYEEGTWTPTWQATLNSGTFAATATYTKIGNVVTIQMAQTSGNVSFTLGQYIVGGYPFGANNGQAGGGGVITDRSPTFGQVVLLDTSARIYATAAASNKTNLVINATYLIS